MRLQRESQLPVAALRRTVCWLVSFLVFFLLVALGAVAVVQGPQCLERRDGVYGRYQLCRALRRFVTCAAGLAGMLLRR